MKRLILSFIICVSICTLLFTAVVFFIVALYLFLNSIVASAALAAFLSGLIFIGCALFLLFVLFLINQITKARYKSSYEKMVSHFNIKESVKTHPIESASIALLMGAIIGSSTSIRKKIMHAVILTIEEIGNSPNTTQAMADILSKFLKNKINNS